MGDWEKVNWSEIMATIGGSIFIGVVRFLYLLRRGRKFQWFDLVLEPCLAIIGGMLMWALTEATQTPDLLQAVMTSLGAWGGPRTIHVLEKKYMGGSRRTDNGAAQTAPGDL